MRSLHKTFPGLDVNEEVPIPQNPDLAVPYDFLLEQWHDGTAHLPWPGIKGRLSVAELLEGLEEPRTKEHSMGPNIDIKIDNRSQSNPVVQVTTAAESQAISTSSVDFQFSMELGKLQGAVAELKDELVDAGAAETAKNLETVETRLDTLENLEDSPETKKKARGPMNKLRRLLEDFNNKESTAGKALKKVQDGTRIAQDLAGKYNSIAEWCGLPQVPSVFLGKS